jgi:hypothetical protein
MMIIHEHVIAWMLFRCLLGCSNGWISCCLDCWLRMAGRIISFRVTFGNQQEVYYSEYGTRTYRIQPRSTYKKDRPVERVSLVELRSLYADFSDLSTRELDTRK